MAAGMQQPSPTPFHITEQGIACGHPRIHRNGPAEHGNRVIRLACLHQTDNHITYRTGMRRFNLQGTTKSRYSTGLVTRFVQRSAEITD